jgi:hypothetical protein
MMGDEDINTTVMLDPPSDKNYHLQPAPAHSKFHPAPLQLYCKQRRAVLKTVRSVSELVVYGLIYKIVLELRGTAVNQERVDSRNFWNTGI